MGRLFQTLGFKLWGDNWLQSITDGISGGSAADDVEDLTEDYEDLSNAVEEYKNQLLGFDEVNKLDSNKSSSSSATAAGTIDLSDAISKALGDYESVWNEALANSENYSIKIADRIIAGIKKGNWGDVGKIIGDSTADSLLNIDWNRIYEGGRSFANNLASFLNGMFTGDLLSGVGLTLAGALNTSVYTALEFGNVLDWKGLGTALGNGLNTFIENADLKAVGQSLSVYILGLLDFFISALKTVNWYNAGKKIGDFFANLDYTEIAKAIIKALALSINACFGLIAGFFDSAPLETALVGLFALMKFNGLGAALGSSLGPAVSTTLGSMSFGNIMIAAVVTGVLLKWAHERAKLIYDNYEFEDIQEAARAMCADKFGENWFSKTSGDVISVGTAFFADPSSLTEAMPRLLKDIGSGDFKFNFLNLFELPSYNETKEYTGKFLGIVGKALSGGKSFEERYGISWEEAFLGEPGKKSNDKLPASWTNALNSFADKVKAQLTDKGKETGASYGTQVGVGVGTTLNVTKGGKIESIMKSINEFIKGTGQYAGSVYGSNVGTGFGLKFNEKKDGVVETILRKINDMIKGTGQNAGASYGANVGTGFGLNFNEKKNGTVESILTKINNMIKGTGKNAGITYGNNVAAGFKESMDKVKFKMEIKGSVADLSNGGFYGMQMVAQYATGGFPESGQLFMANENGPELVGRGANGGTMVANNYQIIEGIREASYQGMKQALSENNGSVNINVVGDPQGMFKVMQSQANNYTRATGLSAFPV